MELKAAIEQRYSVRKFKPSDVPVDTLKELVNRAGLAPSVNNAQPWKFWVVTNKETINEMASIVHKKVQDEFAETDKENVLKTVDYFSTVFEHAPAVLLVGMKPYKAIADDLKTEQADHERVNKMRHYPDIQSIGAAVEHVLLSAVDLGLGGCWLSGLMVAQSELEDLLHIEAPWELVTAIAIGTPDEDGQQRPKKPVDEIFELVD